MTIDWSDQAAELDGGLPSVLHDHEASAALEQVERDDATSPTVRALKLALDYMLVGQGERREREGVFAPQIEWQDGRRYPPRPEDIDEEIRQLWRVGAERATNALLAARLADLSWTLRQPPRPDLAARAAVSNYLVLARREANPDDALEQVHHAQRAREIATEIKDEELASQAAVVLLDLAEPASGEVAPYPGVVLGALGALLGSALTEALLARRDSLLAAARRLLQSDPHNYESATQMVAQVLPLERRSPLYREVVQRWLDAANAAQDGSQQFMLRQHALEQALLYDLRDEADAVRVLLEAHDHDDLGLKVVQSEAKIEGFAELREVYLGSSFVETLTRIGQGPPPAGSREANQRPSRNSAAKGHCRPS